MEKSKGLFQILDQLIFSQIDLYKKSPLYSKINENLSTLDDNVRDIINKALTVFVLILPLLIVLIFNSTNNGLREDLAVKNEIYELINSYKNKKADVQILGRRVLSPQTVTDRKSLQKRIDRTLTRKKIENSNVSIKNFSQDSSFGSVNKVSATISFKSFSTTNLSDLMYSLLQSEKMKISEINVKRDNKTNQIKGSFKILHFGKAK